MDPCGSLVLFPPGSPVELDICKLALPAAAFTVTVSLLESERRRRHRPSWASSCMGDEGQGGGVVGYYVPQIERSPSGSNSSVTRACWLMWTSSSCSPVDGAMWCLFVYMCVSSTATFVCVFIAYYNEGEPNAILSHSSSFSFSKFAEITPYNCVTVVFFYHKTGEKWVRWQKTVGIITLCRAHGTFSQVLDWRHMVVFSRFYEV